MFGRDSKLQYMCGIVGSFGVNNELDWVRCENSKLCFRGPDAQIAKSITPNLSMGVSRLAMTDPHPRSNQPMFDSATGNVISFNGEVYNYKEIRESLKINGLDFKTESDTEVLLKYLSFKGISALTELNGMFAFAFYTRKDEKLTLSRDRLGKKPLYYTFHRGNIRWSSSLSSLRKVSLKKTISDEALLQYLSLGYLLDPVTTYSEILAVKPGQVLSLTLPNLANGYQFESSQYQNQVSDYPVNLPLRQVVGRSVSDRISGHEKVAITLSGGVDSSVIALELSQRHGNARAFTAKWSDSDKLKYNLDSDLAFKISSKLGIPLEIVEMLHAKNLHSELNKFLTLMQEPNNNPSGISMLKLYEQIADSGHRLILTGDGSDEIFGGYARHLLSSRVRNYLHLENLNWISNFHANVNGGSTALSKLFATQISPRIASSWLYWHWTFTPRELRNILHLVKSSAEITNKLSESIHNLETNRITGNPESIMKRDHEIWLAMESNRKLDRVSMGFSTEARSPFQDERVIAWAKNFMVTHTFRKLSKVALWEAYPELAGLGVRTDKAGFISPVGHWLRSNPGLVNSSLEFLSKDSRFNPSGLNFYREAPERGRFRELTQLWTLVVLAAWLQLET